MIVLSRRCDECIEIRRSEVDCWIVTVVEIRGEKTQLLSTNIDLAKAIFRSEMRRDDVRKLDSGVEMTVVDIRGDKVRLGITAPKDYTVHRLEVARAIRREHDAAKRAIDGDQDGLAESSVPSPGGPRPPELDVRLEEPRSDDTT